MNRKKISRRLLRFSTVVFCLNFLGGCAATAPSESAPGDPLSIAIRFYEGPLDHLSAVRGGECPMFPSCSAYAKRALQKYGFFTGWMMASERLMRCGRDEIRLSPKIFVDGRWKTYDPLENNTFWWDRGNL